MEVARLLAHYNLKDGDINHEISDVHIEEISQSLFLDDSEDGEKGRKFLLKWKKEMGSRATYKNLIDALLVMKCMKEVESVLKIVRDSVSSSNCTNADINSRREPDPKYEADEDNTDEDNTDEEYTADEDTSDEESAETDDAKDPDPETIYIVNGTKDLIIAAFSLGIVISCAMDRRKKLHKTALEVSQHEWETKGPDSEEDFDKEVESNGDLEELPFYKDARVRRERIQKCLPENCPDQGTKEFKSLDNFCLNVEIVLQTVEDNGYYAATLFLQPPNDLFKNSVIFPENFIVLGMFAGKKTALILTRVSEKTEEFIEKVHSYFPRVVYFIGIGVCYTFDEKYKLGDVIVSGQICSLTNSARGGEITEDRDGRIEVVDDLQDIFCRGLLQVPEFKVSERRSSVVHSGPIISYPVPRMDADFRNEVLRAIPGAIAGEIEGGHLLKYVRRSKVKGVIKIKGVVDYRDKAKLKDWQFITAMAALHYTESKLRNLPSLLDEDGRGVYGVIKSCCYCLSGILIGFVIFNVLTVL